MNQYVYVVERHDYNDVTRTYGTEYITFNFQHAYDYIMGQIISRNYTYEGEQLYVNSFAPSKVMTDSYIYLILKFMVEP